MESGYRPLMGGADIAGGEGSPFPDPLLLEDPCGVACVCGEPVKVVFGKRFCRVSGCVDDAQDVPLA